MDKAAIDALLDQLFALAATKLKGPIAAMALAMVEAALKSVVDQYVTMPVTPPVTGK